MRSPALVLVALAASLAAQTPQPSSGVHDPRLRLSFPDDADAALHTPFVDAATGLPRAPTLRAAGSGDFDGDANVEAWYLAADGSLAVMMAQTADLGRYLPYARLPATGFRDAVDWRRAGATSHRLAAVVPGTPTLWSVDYATLAGQGPRDGMFTAGPTAVTVGTHAVEIAAADADGDGNDDLVVLREARSGGVVVGASVDCLEFRDDPQRGWHLAASWTVDLPLPCDTLRAGDLDGDGRTDWAVHVPGIGVAAFAAGPTPRSGRLLGAIATGNLPLRDLAVDDATGDGRDDLLVTLDEGLLIGEPRGAAQSVWRALPAPAGLGPLAGAALLDSDADGARDLVLVPRDVQALAVFPFDPTSGRYTAPWTQTPPAASSAFAAGGTTHGRAAFTTDVDGDGDRDLLLQAPHGGGWLTLHGTAVDLSPLAVSISPAGDPAPSGFLRHEVRVDVPAALLSRGVTALEIAALLRDPVSGDFAYWSRTVTGIDPVTRRVVVPIEVMMDPVNVGWLRSAGLTSWLGAMTAGGDTVLSIHAKDGPRRHQAVVVQWDGDQGPQGSAVGVRWRVIAAPPLPKSDADLLPWD